MVPFNNRPIRCVVKRGDPLTIVVSQLDLQVDETDLINEFSTFGEIAKVNVKRKLNPSENDLAGTLATFFSLFSGYGELELCEPFVPSESDPKRPEKEQFVILP